MYHPRLNGSHYEMGKKTGTIFTKANVSFPIKLDSFQKKHGKESFFLLKKHFPEAAEEIRGVTDAGGYDNELFASWMMCMGCCLYNLEEGNSVEIRGCTAFAFTDRGALVYGRNNDLPLFLKKGSKSILYRPDGGNTFLLNTSSFINGEEGINEHGLIAAMTFVLPRMDEIKPGLNSVFLVRYILEKCMNFDEAVEALKTVPVSSSCNILIADKNGKTVVAECNPLDRNMRYPEKRDTTDSFIVTVNNFTSDRMKIHDAGDNNLYFSQNRYDTACKALKKPGLTGGTELAENILGGRYGFMCQYEKESGFDTIWSSIFDVKNKKVLRTEGNPAKTKFTEDNRLEFRG